MAPGAAAAHPSPLSACAVLSPGVLATQQLPPNRRHGRWMPTASMGQYAQQQQQAVQRRALLLGAAAVLASGAPWLGRGQAALAQEFECDPQAGPNGIKWCDIATGFGAPAAAGGPGGAAAAAAPCLWRATPPAQGALPIIHGLVQATASACTMRAGCRMAARLRAATARRPR